jgi:hypothetical protein
LTCFAAAAAASRSPPPNVVHFQARPADNSLTAPNLGNTVTGVVKVSVAGRFAVDCVNIGASGDGGVRRVAASTYA